MNYRMMICAGVLVTALRTIRRATLGRVRRALLLSEYVGPIKDECYPVLVPPNHASPAIPNSPLRQGFHTYPAAFSLAV